MRAWDIYPEMSARTFDFVVVGAGVFGAWSACELLRLGHCVLLLDGNGPAHSRAGSGGESRIIRMGYGADALYTRWALRSLEKWKAIEQRLSRPIFRPTGMLWLAGCDDTYVSQTRDVLKDVGVEHECLNAAALTNEYPQISPDGIEWALREPGSGVLMARQAVQALVADAIERGLEYRTHSVVPPVVKASLDHVETVSGDRISAGAFVFACGAWLPKLFPGLLAQRISPTRQEVCFFAPPSGDVSFSSPAMPAWLDHAALVYGLPDLENRGFKLSIDRHGPAFDPDGGVRLASAECLTMAREYLQMRFPKMRGAALTESRVCQYANTSSGDFIIDRHPQIDNVLIVGGGSGHGFKHGPMVGEYASRLLTSGAVVEPRFSLASKSTTPARSVY